MRTRFSRTQILCASLVLGAWLASPQMVDAQRPRDELIAQAFGEFDPGQRLELLLTAADPQLGPPDSLWTFGIQVLVQTLLDQRQDSLASVWARWAVRRLPEFRLDTLQFLPEMIAVFRRAEEFVSRSRGPGDSVAQVAWEWPARVVSDSSGHLRVAAVPSVPLRIRVDGTGAVDPGDQLSLPVGSHVVEASAEGYQAAWVTREVLPGVTTLLTFALRASRPVLADEERVTRQLVRVTPVRLGDPTCGAGFFAGEGLILTTYQAIRGAERVDITTSDAREFRAEVAAYDVGRDIAAVTVPVAWGDSLMAAADATRGDVVWGLAYEGCATAVSAETQIDSWDAPLGTIFLADSLRDSRQGGPFVNGRGEVVGLGIDPVSAAPIAAARDVLAQARQNLQARQLLSAADVARRENHSYGAVELSSDLPAAVARITGLEPWHWPEVGRMDSLPFTFYGPMGSYQADLVVAGEVRHRQQVAVRPGATDDIVLRTEVAKGRFPWVIAVLGAVAAGGVAAAMGLGGGGGDGNGNGQPTGGITVTWP